MARYMGVEAHIYVPEHMTKETRDKIRQENAYLVVTDGDFDLAVREAEEGARAAGGLLIQDTAWPGYEEIPNVSET